MSDKPFWEQENSATDPETGELKPKRVLEEFEIGGHQFRSVEGPMAAAQITNAEGEEIGTVYLPFDPADGAPSEAMLDSALEFYARLDSTRSNIKADEIDRLVTNLTTTKADGEKPVAEIMIDAVADVISETVSLVRSEGDTEGRAGLDDGLTPEQADALLLEANRLFTEAAPQLVREFANIRNPENGLTFWQDMAQDIIAHATVHAADEAAEEIGGREAVDALTDEEWEAFEPRIIDLYHKGPYLAGAIMQGWRTWLPVLGELVRQGLESTLTGDDANGTTDAILRKARANLGFPGSNTRRGHEETVAPLFRDGVGNKPTHSLIIGTRRALTAPLGRWALDTLDFPAFQYVDTNGVLTYRPNPITFPDPQDAVSAVAGYGVGHQALFKYITMRHMQGAHTKQRGPYGGFYLGIDEFLEARGIKKHVNGGYKSEDRQEVERLMTDLMQLQVSGSHQRNRNKRNKGDRGLRIDAPLIVVSHTVRQPGLTPDDDRVVAWYVRAGDWAAQMDSLPPQYGKTMLALMQLHQQNDSFAIRLGDALEEEFRKRAAEGNWSQPYLASYLFEIVEETIDRRNPERNLKKLTKALDTLASPEKMQGAPMLESWKPVRKVDTYKRGWLDGWLASGYLIMPVSVYRDQYKEIANNRTKKIERNTRKKAKPLQQEG